MESVELLSALRAENRRPPAPGLSMFASSVGSRKELQDGECRVDGRKTVFDGRPVCLPGQKLLCVHPSRGCGTIVEAGKDARELGSFKELDNAGSGVDEAKPATVLAGCRIKNDQFA